MENILLNFLVPLTILFFVPKIIFRLYSIPFPITEIVLGITIGSVFPGFFAQDDILQVIATLGIITLFVHSGMEVDLHFILRKKRFFIENIFRSMVVITLVAVLIKYLFKTSLIVGFVASLGFTTPSASYIFSMLRLESSKLKNWIGGKAIAGELLALMMVVVLLNISKPVKLVISLVAVILLVTLLPFVLRAIYRTVFSKLIGQEFSFIFVVAVISAFVTEMLGLHFLFGAFLAGIVSREFVHHLVKAKEYKHVTVETGQQIIEGFSYFAILFAPFYFFSVGLTLSSQDISFSIVLSTIALGLGILAVRMFFIVLHRRSRIREPRARSFQISVAILPTLFFSFVIAEILRTNFEADVLLYSTLMVYGLVSTIVGFALQRITTSKRRFKSIKTQS